MRLPSQLAATPKTGQDATAAGVGAMSCSLAARGVLALLSAVALAFSAYLAWLSISGGAVPGCDPGGAFDCDHVLSTRWSSWLGVPIALPAAMIYASVLAAVWFLGPTVPSAVRRAAWAIVLSLTAMAALAALWFIGLQAIAIGHYCWPCLTTHTTALLLAAATWTVACRETRGAGNLFGRPAALSAAIAVAAASILIAGQLAYEPQTFRIDRDDSPSGSPSLAATDSQPASGAPPQSPTSPTAPTSADAANDPPHTVQKPPLSRILHLHKTTLTVDAYEQPIVGSPDAEHVIVKLFDYTCHHCRDQHFQLEEARKHFGDRLAIVVLPVPMNHQCNPHASPAGSGPRAHACAYARYAVALWQTDRARFAEFHHWMFEPETPPPVEEVRKMARQLAGQAVIDCADSSPTPRDAIRTYVALYDALGRGNIPKLVDKHFLIDGRFRDGQQIVEVLETEWNPEP